jgi:hypothetical protein
MQGLDLDAAGGVAAPGTWLSRDEEVRRQHAWAEQTDTRLAGVAEQMTIARDNVAHTAGEHLHAHENWGTPLATRRHVPAGLQLISTQRLSSKQRLSLPCTCCSQGRQVPQEAAQPHRLACGGRCGFLGFQLHRARADRRGACTAISA